MSLRRTAALVLGIALIMPLLTVPPRAQDYKVPEHLLDGTNCHCRANGELFPQGDEICMMGRIRTCGMSQNVSSWLQTGRTCHTSSRAMPKLASLVCTRG